MHLRSIAAQFALGEHVTARECPSVGTVAEARFEDGRFSYLVDWPEFPDDKRWYGEGELAAAPRGSWTE